MDQSTRTRFSEDETAAEVGVSKATLRNWRWRGIGPSYLKIGRRVEYFADDVDAWRNGPRRDPRERLDAPLTVPRPLGARDLRGDRPGKAMPRPAGAEPDRAGQEERFR